MVACRHSSSWNAEHMPNAVALPWPPTADSNDLLSFVTRKAFWTRATSYKIEPPSNEAIQADQPDRQQTQTYPPPPLLHTLKHEHHTSTLASADWFGLGDLPLLPRFVSTYIRLGFLPGSVWKSRPGSSLLFLGPPLTPRTPSGTPSPFFEARNPLSSFPVLGRPDCRGIACKRLQWL